MTSLTREAFASTTIAKSDQVNAVDLIGSPLVCRITEIRQTGDEKQPTAIYVDAHPQPWKPSKTFRRVLLACWEGDPSDWIGRTVVLWCDPTILWGGEKVGGVAISHLSHIDGEKTFKMNESRNKKKIITVKPYWPQEQAQQQPQEPVYWPDDAFAKKLEGARLKLESCEMTAEKVIAALEKKAPITAGQRARIEAIKPIQPEPAAQEDDLEPPPPDEFFG